MMIISFVLISSTLHTVKYLYKLSFLLSLQIQTRYPLNLETTLKIQCTQCYGVGARLCKVFFSKNNKKETE
jgi:hypothetical protein